MENLPLADQPDLLEQAIAAIDAEIQSVLQHPSKDTLHDGVRQPAVDGKFIYRFENAPAGLRFVEQVRHVTGSGPVVFTVTDEERQAVLLETDKDLGEHLESLKIEWENDFVLQKTLNRLHELELLDANEDGLSSEVLDFFLKKGWVQEKAPVIPKAIAQLNAAQNAAVSKALSRTVSFIWGPPGTGKTSTLGYVVQGLLSSGCRVLFLSNTNRAVDVGMQSILGALASAGKPHLIQKTTRFGELALQTPELAAIHFEQIIDRLRVAQSASQAENSAASVNERSELGRFRCIGTTLAKVCTSDLFNNLAFDAVVVDEASMVNLAYVLVAASRAKKHLIFAGDPMQLPPISQTDAEPHRSFLEKDVYLYASGAKTPSDLFAWHDAFPEVTTFFETQYRLSDQLAEVISQVFYEGRLNTAVREQNPQNAGARIWVFDTVELAPELETEGEGTGFRPLNRMHVSQTVALVQRLVFRSGFAAQDIGIITPFRHSARTYWKELRKNGLDGVETGTVHTFQGREKQVIIFDTVMTGETTASGKKRHYTVRPFDEQKNGLSVPRLLNVALSRCKDRLVVVADLEHIKTAYRGRFLHKLVDALCRAGQVITRIPD